MHNEEKNHGFMGVQVTWKGYLALIFAIVFFSGALAAQKGWMQIFDFASISGSFGTMKDPIKNTFMGIGGSGAKEGFLFALSLFPGVIFALGIIQLIEHYGGLKAAQKLLTVVLRPLFGLPGISGLAIITNLQSTDASAGMVKALFEGGEMTDKERAIFCGWAFTGGGTITNYFAIVAGIFSFFTVPIGLPLAVVFCFKVFGANLMRLYVKLVKDD